MTRITLKERLIEARQDGLSEVLAAMAENAVLYRKWGDLGKWGETRFDIQNRVKKYQPDFLPVIFKIFNEA